MLLHVNCPQCDKSYKLGRKLLGKKVSCKDCKAVFRVQDTQSEGVSRPPSVPPVLSKRVESGLPSHPIAPSAGRKWILIGGIAGGAFLLLIFGAGFVFWMGMNSGLFGPSAQPVAVATNDPSVEEQKNNVESSATPSQPINDPVNKVDSDLDASVADKVPAVANESFVVPEKIEEFPPQFSSHSLAEFLDAIRQLPYEEEKDEFEKTDDFSQRMKAIWPNSTLFGQPSSSRFVYVAESDEIETTYDADAEEISVRVENPLSEMAEEGLTLDKFIFLDNISFPGANVDSHTFKWHCKPSQARSLVKEIRVAFVVRFGAPPIEENDRAFGWNYSPSELTRTDSTPFETVVSGVRIKDELITKYFDLWVEELSEIILFRHDTGEIVQRLEVTAEWQEIHDALAIKNYAKALSFDPDNEVLKALSELNSLAEKNLPECLNTFDGEVDTGLSEVSDQNLCLAISPDGKWIAAAGLIAEGGVRIQILDAMSGDLLETLDGPSSDITSLSFSPDGQWIASVTREHEVRVWKLKNVLVGQGRRDDPFFAGSNLQPTKILNQVEPVHAMERGGEFCFAFSPDSASIVTAGSGNIEVWSVESGRRLKSFETNRVKSVAFSPDGKWLASGDEGGAVKIWDVQTGTCHKKLAGPGGAVSCVWFHDSGSFLFSASDDRTIKAWRPSGGEIINAVEHGIFAQSGFGSIEAASFCEIWKLIQVQSRTSTDGKWLVSDSGDLNEVLPEHSGIKINSVLFSPDGSRIFSADELGFILTWDASSVVSYAQYSRQVNQLSEHLMNDLKTKRSF